jgi:NTF2 fold immunity protein
MKAHRAGFAVLLLLTAAHAQSYAPKEGFVPDSATAIKIAEAVLIPVYGKEKIESDRPFKATLESGVWTAMGTLHCPDGKGGVTTSCVGGTKACLR